MSKENVVLDEIVDSVQRIIIRNAVGRFANSGPRRNIITVESRVAFSTALNELYREGYQMVTPQEYAEQYSLDQESVYRKIREEGTLFLLVYPDSEPPCEAVPLEERSVVADLGRHLT